MRLIASSQSKLHALPGLVTLFLLTSVPQHQLNKVTNCSIHGTWAFSTPFSKLTPGTPCKFS